MTQTDLMRLLSTPPGETLLHFGAQVGWGPGREARGDRGVRRRVKGVCPECGGPLGSGLSRLETKDNVCAGCMRSHYRGHKGAVHAADPKRPGRAAGRIAGAADPRLSAYERARREREGA